MQDFYAHTNWVESGPAGLFAPLLGDIPVIEPFSTLGGLVVLDDAHHPDGWSVHRPKSSVYPASVKPTAKKNGNTFPTLFSGTTKGITASYPDSCPEQVQEITHDYLAKDDPTLHSAEHLRAVDLALQQTKHEWCRFVDRVYASYGSLGVKQLCDKWVDKPADANASCLSLPPQARWHPAGYRLVSSFPRW
jgi:hypothetical protein